MKYLPLFLFFACQNDKSICPTDTASEISTLDTTDTGEVAGSQVNVRFVNIEYGSIPYYFDGEYSMLGGLDSSEFLIATSGSHTIEYEGYYSTEYSVVLQAEYSTIFISQYSTPIVIEQNSEPSVGILNLFSDECPGSSGPSVMLALADTNNVAASLNGASSFLPFDSEDNYSVRFYCWQCIVDTDHIQTSYIEKPILYVMIDPGNGGLPSIYLLEWTGRLHNVL